MAWNFGKSHVINTQKSNGERHPKVSIDQRMEYKFLFNSLTPELIPSWQCCLSRFFTGDFASWTMHFVNVYVKNQQMQKLFIQFIKYVW
jgi:hypothetical protein